LLGDLSEARIKEIVQYQFPAEQKSLSNNKTKKTEGKKGEAKKERRKDFARETDTALSP